MRRVVLPNFVLILGLYDHHHTTITGLWGARWQARASAYAQLQASPGVGVGGYVTRDGSNVPVETNMYK